ncbi:MAG: hypothetical protein WD689_09070 [Gaiellaceae bacterium]
MLVGLVAAFGAAIPMGLSEALSDDGALTGRGAALSRGLITGVATFVGGAFHAVPFVISDVGTALTVAYVLVAVELLATAWIRGRYLQVGLARSLVKVTLGGAVIASVGIMIGQG